MSRSKITTEDYPQIRDTYNWGFSLEDTARLFRVRGTTILRHMQLMDAPRREPYSAVVNGHKRSLSDEEVAKVVELYELGYSLREVARFTYTSPTAARSYLIDAGVEMRQQGGWAYNKNRLSGRDMDATIWLYCVMGFSASEISIAQNIACSTVLHRLRKAGVKIRTRSESAKLRWKLRGRKSTVREERQV